MVTAISQAKRAIPTPAPSTKASSTAPIIGSTMPDALTVALRKKKLPNVDTIAVEPPNRAPNQALPPVALNIPAPAKAPDTTRAVIAIGLILSGAAGNLSPIKFSNSHIFQAVSNDIGLHKIQT